ncbi:MAG TPA: hypothetical protein VF486_04420 [Actinomycetes bacterium]
MQMASNEQQSTRRRQLVTTWALPAVSAVLGAVMWAASWIGGHPALGLAMFGVMIAFGAIFVVGRRSETIRLMAAGRHADERWRSIDLRATAFGGSAVTTAVILAFIWEIAHGRSGNPFAQLGAIAGVAYLVAVIWLRWRS